MFKMVNNLNSKWRRFNFYLKKYKVSFFIIVGLTYLSIPLGLISPYLSKLMIDKAYVAKDLNMFIFLALISAGALILDQLIKIFKIYNFQHISREMRFDFKNDVFKHIQSLSVNFFKDNDSSRILYKIDKDINLICTFIYNFNLNIWTFLPNFLSKLFMIFYINWKFAIIISFLAIISFIHPYIFTKKLIKMRKKIIRNSENIFRLLQNKLNFIVLIKSFGKEKYEIKSYKNSLKKHKKVNIMSDRLSNISNISKDILNKTIIGIVRVIHSLSAEISYNFVYFIRVIFNHVYKLLLI